jgi:hypothetical protein
MNGRLFLAIGTMYDLRHVCCPGQPSFKITASEAIAHGLDQMRPHPSGLPTAPSPSPGSLCRRAPFLFLLMIDSPSRSE